MPEGGPDAVADALWQRVRVLAERIAALEAVAALDGLDEEGRARLDSLRRRCSRAVDRAGLADTLGDEIAARRPGPRPPLRGD